MKIGKGKIKEDEKYTCPICDHRLQIPRESDRPRLENFESWVQEAHCLPFIPEEFPLALKIADRARQFRMTMQPFLHSVGFTQAEVPIMRFYLRKIEGAELLLQPEHTFFQLELHKWHPIAPHPPTPIQVSKHTRKPRPTKQQKLLAEFGVSNPKDLPEEVRSRINANVFRKRQDENDDSIFNTSSHCALPFAGPAMSNTIVINQESKLSGSDVLNENLDSNGKCDMNNLFEALAGSGEIGMFHNFEESTGNGSNEQQASYSPDVNIGERLAKALNSFPHDSSQDKSISSVQFPRKEEDVDTSQFLENM